MHTHIHIDKGPNLMLTMPVFAGVGKDTTNIYFKETKSLTYMCYLTLF